MNEGRRAARGARFLRMAGVADVAEARALWKDPAADVHRRCLAARANAALGKHGPSWRVIEFEKEDSRLARGWCRANRDWERRVRDEPRIRAVAAARDGMHQLDVTTMVEVVALLRDASQPSERRCAAASVLRGFRCREAVPFLIEALAEGELTLAGTCMWALLGIGSRRGARRLIEIARGGYPLAARQEAIYTLWRLGERRAEPLFIHLCAAVGREEEYTRDMATEALGNTNGRLRSQWAIAGRLFDPSPSVRYSALCACQCQYEIPEFLRLALVAKLDDPDRVDDDRVIAVFAAQILDGHSGHRS